MYLQSGSVVCDVPAIEGDVRVCQVSERSVVAVVPPTL